jgi:hypothetical protein
MIILGLKLFIICYVLSDLAGFISELIDTIVVSKIKWLSVLKSLFVYLLSCSKCFSLWFSLILSGNLFLACLIALSIDIVKRIEMKWFRGDTEL